MASGEKEEAGGMERVSHGTGKRHTDHMEALLSVCDQGN